MDAVCAWCGKVLRGEGQGIVTHSICGECALNVEYRRIPLAEFLDRLPGPVCAVDEEGRLLAANRSLCTTMRSESQDLVSRLLGDVFQCVYAGQPGGCGHTVHCTGCTIRREVTRARVTGVPRSGVRAYTFVTGPQGPEQLDLELSTEVVGDVVLVRLDSVRSQLPGATRTLSSM